MKLKIKKFYKNKTILVTVCTGTWISNYYGIAKL